MAIPERKLLEQKTIAVRIAEQAESLLVQILQGDEVAVLPPERILPAVGIEREVLWRRRFVAAEQVDDEPDVHETVSISVGGGFLVEPVEVR